MSYQSLTAFFDDHRNPSQEALAREFGISRAFLSMIKHRQREPNMQLAIAIMERCRVPLTSLVWKKRRRRKRRQSAQRSRRR